MIQNSYAIVESNGKTVIITYWEDAEVREGPATFPARYASFAAIIQYVETQFNRHYLSISQRVEIQGLLGSPWPHAKIRFNWKDCLERVAA